MSRWRDWSAALAVIGGVAAASVARRRRGEAEGLDLRGRTVVITGGSRGLGLVLAREFAAEGAHLVLLGRDAATLERARQELAARGTAALAIPCDVGDRAAVERAIARVVEEEGGSMSWSTMPGRSRSGRSNR
jgi:predicted amino acid dehydrogenase